MSLTIVGLGPGSLDMLTDRTRRAIEQSERLYLRTARHPLVATIVEGREFTSFDHLYDSEERFESVYEKIAATIESAAREGDMTYAVPGHPLFGEATVRLLLARLPDAEVIDGVSFVEPACRMVGLDPLELGLQIVDGLAVAAPDPSRPLLAGQVYNQRAASELKLAASKWYPHDHPVTVLHDLSLESERTRSIALGQLDHGSDFDHLTCVYLPPVAIEANTRTLAGLRSIVRRLRSPEGCPWDNEQTHQSLRSDLLEETYEVLAALD
ncbi:MAG TPA: SAM-dependent methyltransferase, partial [Dehalococcoidia bacterium]|nr:SAM-dependent methyltransferase [Dehalococcoidia bacterium]